MAKAGGGGGRAMAAIQQRVAEASRLYGNYQRQLTWAPRNAPGTLRKAQQEMRRAVRDAGRLGYTVTINGPKWW